jgi:dTDP-4-dehydrorhamnose 3,5-epimerase
MMGYVSMTRPGVARGPHEHRAQTDLFCFLGPSTFRLYLWDNRPDSPSLGRKAIMDAGENERLMVLVPPGVVHAYVNIGEGDGLVFNSPNQLFRGPGRLEEVDEIRHETDPDSPFKID